MPSLLSGLRHHCCNKCNQAQWARYFKLEQLLGLTMNITLEIHYTLVVYVTYTHYKSKT